MKYSIERKTQDKLCGQIQNRCAYFSCAAPCPARMGGTNFAVLCIEASKALLNSFFSAHVRLRHPFPLAVGAGPPVCVRGFRGGKGRLQRRCTGLRRRSLRAHLRAAPWIWSAAAGGMACAGGDVRDRHRWIFRVCRRRSGTSGIVKIAPCRYSELVYNGSDVIGGMYYETAAAEAQESAAVQEMIAGDRDLTLLTCTRGGVNRTAVRCGLVEEK